MSGVTRSGPEGREPIDPAKVRPDETILETDDFPAAGASGDIGGRPMPPPTGTPAGHGLSDSEHKDASETLGKGPFSGPK